MILFSNPNGSTLEEKMTVAGVAARVGYASPHSFFYRFPTAGRTSLG
ncbi:hypothetical protein [Nostoc sp.]